MTQVGRAGPALANVGKPQAAIPLSQDAVPVLQQNYDSDAADLERALVNSAQATRERLGAMTTDELNQSIEFWIRDPNEPKTPASQKLAQEMLMELAEARANAARMAGNDSRNAGRGGANRQLSAEDAQLMDTLVNGGY